MTLTADQIVDRRRLKRKLSLWRVVAFVAVALAIVAVVSVSVDRTGLAGFGAQVARISIAGFISVDREQAELIEMLGKDDRVKGVIVAINSTGGASAGGEVLYEGLRRLAERKPTVAVIETVGASAAYMAAIATDHVIARRSTITGSIGVLFQYPEISNLLDKIGVDVEEITSTPLKAQPSLFEPASDEAKAVIVGVVRDIYNWFVDIVADRRNLARTTALTLADGRIMTGSQALEAKLIDEIGGEREAIAWLASQGVDDRLPVKDWRPKNSGGGWLSISALVLWIAEQTGVRPDLLGGKSLDELLPQRLLLDGVMSVWQVRHSGFEEPAKGLAQ